MNKFIIKIIIIIFIILNYVNASEQELISVTNSIDVKGETYGGISYKIIIQLENTKLILKDKKWIGLDDEARIGTKIKKFMVLLNDKIVNIPEDAYVDLADLHLSYIPSLTTLNSELRLSFSGSDGAGAYSGVFTFLDNKLTRRQISEYYGQFENKVITIDTKY